MTLTEAETLIVHEALGVLIQSLTDRRLDAALKARRIVTAAVVAIAEDERYERDSGEWGALDG
jgi:hypothetical protein